MGDSKMSFQLKADESQPDLRKRVRSASTRALLECVALYEHSQTRLTDLAVVKAEIAIRQHWDNVVLRWVAILGGIGGLISLGIQISQVFADGTPPSPTP
jgi:hypothetical protein